MSGPLVVGGCTLHLGDCREVLQSFPPATFDCVIADPPYGETSLDWDRCVDGWLDACRRVMKPSASLWCFGSMAFFMERAADFRAWTKGKEIVWRKHNCSGPAVDGFPRVHEHVVQFYPAGAKWGEVYKDPQRVPGEARPSARIGSRKQPPHRGKIGSTGYEYGDERLMPSVIEVRSCHGHAIHETQKPVGIIAPLLAYSCPPGGLVLETFGGACSVAIAARASGRRCVSIELRADCYAKAVERLQDDAPLLSGAAA